MSDELPSVTIIIPARPDEPEVRAAIVARQFDYPAKSLEIILARGTQPSAQRNAALREARGELIYFLDDDSLAPPGNLRRAVAHFRNPKVEMVGGPNLCPPEAPPSEQVFALVLASWLAFGPSRARYAKVGGVRATSEKELILCNLVARRETLLKHGGFNEALYPNEENALMDKIQRAGGKLLYDPELFVYRRPRGNLRAFAKMLQTYGRGRAEQFRATPTLGSALNFVPPLFLVYLLTLPVVWAGTFVPAAEWERELYTLPLMIYGMAVLVQVIALIPRSGAVRGLCALPLIVLTHLLYGYGFWCGLFTRLKPPAEISRVPVQLETLALS